jgi:threonine dehydratase
MDLTVTPDDIRKAAARLAWRVVRTPCLHSETLSAIAGCEVWLKFENLQFTASLKEHAALKSLAQLTEAERARGVLAVSAGNHAQGVALHASVPRRGLRSVFGVMSRGCPVMPRSVSNARSLRFSAYSRFTSSRSSPVIGHLASAAGSGG